MHSELLSARNAAEAAAQALRDALAKATAVEALLIYQMLSAAASTLSQIEALQAARKEAR